DHLADQIVGTQVCCVDRVHEAAVLQDGDPVAQVEDLFQPVGDVEHGNAALLQPPDQGVEQLDLVVRQCRSGLVHGDDAGIEAHRLDDLDHLLLGHGQAADLAVRGDAFDAQVREQGGCVAGHPGLIHQAPAAWFATEVDVLRHGALGQQVELLEDRGHPGSLGLQRVGEADLPSLEGDRPAVGLVHAGQDLHHGGLAGPVLSHQCMHLPRMYHQVDPVQDLNSAEGLGDPLHLQDGPGRGRTHHATSTGVAACFPSTATSLTAID